MKVAIQIPASAATLSALMEGLVATNYVLLDRMRDPPRLYDSGVVYVPEPPGFEKWLTIPQVLRIGQGDCEDLACWLAAELRFFDAIPARAVAYRSGKKKFHAVVLYPDGSIEDPSEELGMERR